MQLFGNCSMDLVVIVWEFWQRRRHLLPMPNITFSSSLACTMQLHYLFGQLTCETCAQIRTVRYSVPVCQLPMHTFHSLPSFLVLLQFLIITHTTHKNFLECHEFCFVVSLFCANVLMKTLLAPSMCMPNLCSFLHT